MDPHPTGMEKRPKAAIYARVSTADQRCAAQLHDLRAYAAARGLESTEFVGEGVSGTVEIERLRDPEIAHLCDHLRQCGPTVAEVAPLGDALRHVRLAGLDRP